MTHSLSADQIKPILRGYLSERWSGVYENGHGALIVPNLGHTACFVEPGDTKDGRVRIDIRAPILLGIPPSPDIYQLVALNATNWAFGALSLYEEDGLNLEFDYAILAEPISSSVLNYLVETVSRTADNLATKLRGDFGGRFLC